MEGYADFSAQLWLQNVKVEDGKSVDDLKEKLYSMTLQEMLEDGIVKDLIINDDVDITITEVEQKVKVYNIDYDIDDPEVFSKLLKEVEVEIRYNPNREDIEDAIADELTLKTEVDINKFDYEILETK